MPTKKPCDTYILDTYRQGQTGAYRAGAITFRGKKKVETLSWHDREFPSQSEADEFVRQELSCQELIEANHVGELRKR